MRIALTILLVLLLAGCGAAVDAPGATAPETPEAPAGTTAPETTPPPAGPAETAAPASSEATPAPSGPEETPAPAGTSLPAGSVEEKAAQVLAQQLGVDVGTLRLTAKEPQEWSDGALGCPVPGQMYTQVIVPGFRLTFTAGTNTYEVHTDAKGDTAVLCEGGRPTPLGSGDGGLAPPVE